MKIQSPAFNHEGDIPEKYTCKGEDINPELHISDLPPGTKSLTLIVDDPDAPVGTWDHWIVWNIDAKTRIIEEGILPDGAVQGLNGWKTNEYRGPCPPKGKHRYFFTLYALDTTLVLDPNRKKHRVMEAMEGHILDQAQLMGTYKR